MNNARRGFRGYIASRAVRGVRTPQRVQNLVVRDYAARHGLPYRLSAVEYVMPHCYMMLENVLAELDVLEGAIAFSVFMLPKDPRRRAEVYDRALAAGAQLHFALENLAVRTPADVAACEDLIAVAETLGRVPFGGDYSTMLSDERGIEPFARTR